jgi:hypothetical protein
VPDKMANWQTSCRIVAKWPQRTSVSHEKRAYRGLAILSGRNL